jgi:hypothetical protein
MSRTKEILGTVYVSKWSKIHNSWIPYSQAHDYLLIDFEEVKRQNAVMVEDGMFLYQFESSGIDNIQTYFSSHEYCL